MKGIFTINKPRGITSNAVVQAIKKATREKRVGHAGTLDPLAGGVLIVGVGRKFTKRLSAIFHHEKEYFAVIKLGIVSETDDGEGEKRITFPKSKKPPTLVELKKVLNQFKGQIWQKPPNYSAIKINGQEAYKRIRRGEKISLPKRKVEIKVIQLIKYHWPWVKIRVICGPGTYIRSLARDIGAALGSGGYLYYLRRTRVGDFEEQNAINLDNFIKRARENKTR